MGVLLADPVPSREKRGFGCLCNDDDDDDDDITSKAPTDLSCISTKVEKGGGVGAELDPWLDPMVDEAAAARGRVE